MSESLGKTPGRSAFLRLNSLAYERLLRPVIFRSSAQAAHERMYRWLRRADAFPWPMDIARWLAAKPEPVTCGGVMLNSPLILAAGLVKGDGFESEAAALDAVERGKNIIPGWRSLPRLVGAVEFGSFTRWPRLGNPGTVVWRDVSTHSTQNRVGLRNPGARAAAAFLGRHAPDLPHVFGINIAVSPGVDDPAQQTSEVLESVAAFIDRGVYPTWFTLNLSCPNTEDDPRGHQTADAAQQACGATVDFLASQNGHDIPLWVKVGPNLGDEQYRALMNVFDSTGVRAVVATNTLPMPAPGAASLQAGVGGGQLHDRAIAVAALLMNEKRTHGYQLDIIGCGGVEDGSTYQDFARLGIAVVHYWTALIYRGPLASAIIHHEAHS